MAKTTMSRAQIEQIMAAHTAAASRAAEHKALETQRSRETLGRLWETSSRQPVRWGQAQSTNPVKGPYNPLGITGRAS